MCILRKFSWVGLLILFALGMAGCQSPEPPPEPVTITLGLYEYQIDYFEPRIEEFQQLHPEITVEFRELPNFQGFNVSDYPEIDVYGVDLSFFLQNQVDEILLDLSPLIEQDQSFDLTDFYPGTLELFSSNNRVYALPSGIDSFVLYYNKDLFDLNGLDYPTNEWNWNDMLTAALVIQDDNSDTFGYGVPETHFDLNALILMSQHGGQLFDDLENPTQVIYNHPLNVEAMQWFGNLYHLHYVAPTIEQANELFGFGDQAILRGVLQGKIGIWPGYFSERGGETWPSDWQNLSWGVVAMPRDLHAVTSGFGSGYAITAGSPYPEAAWEFLTFLSEQPPFFLSPARRSIAESKEYVANENEEIAAAARRSAENITLISTDLVQFGEDLQYITPMVADIVSGEATAQEALDWAQAQVDGP